MNAFYLKFIELFKGPYSVSYQEAYLNYHKDTVESPHRPAFEESFPHFYLSLFINRAQHPNLTTNESLSFDTHVPFGITEKQLLKIIPPPLYVNIETPTPTLKAFGYDVLWKGSECRKIFLVSNNRFISGLRIFNNIEQLTNDITNHVFNLTHKWFDETQALYVENKQGQILTYDPDTFYPKLVFAYHQKSEASYYKAIFNFWMQPDIQFPLN